MKPGNLSFNIKTLQKFFLLSSLSHCLLWQEVASPGEEHQSSHMQWCTSAAF